MLADFSDDLVDFQQHRLCCRATISTMTIAVKSSFYLPHPAIQQIYNFKKAELSPKNWSESQRFVEKKYKRNTYTRRFGEFFKFFDIFGRCGSNRIQYSLSMTNFIDFQHCLKFNLPNATDTLHISVQMLSAM